MNIHIYKHFKTQNIFELRHEISNNVLHVCVSNKGKDQPVHTRSLIIAVSCRFNILGLLSYRLNTIWNSTLKGRLQRPVRVYTCQNTTLLEITCHGSILDRQEYADNLAAVISNEVFLLFIHCPLLLPLSVWVLCCVLVICMLKEETWLLSSYCVNVCVLCLFLAMSWVDL